MKGTQVYAVVFGKNHACGVFPDKKLAHSLMLPSSVYQEFDDYGEAWKFVREQLDQDSQKPTKSSKKKIPKSPGAPPIELAGEDESLQDADALFGISLDITTAELRRKLSPPGLDAEQAKDYCETMIDSVALPGKFLTTTEAE